MKPANCPMEAAVSKAVRSRKWDESLAAHAAECAVCGEAMRAAHWMRELAGDSRENPALPDPGLLWQRSRWAEMLSRRQTEIERKRRVMEWAALMPLAVAVFGLIVWGAWNASLLESALAWFVAELSPQTWLAAYHVASANPVALWAGIGIVVFAVLFFATQIFAEG